MLFSWYKANITANQFHYVICWPNQIFTFLRFPSKLVGQVTGEDVDQVTREHEHDSYITDEYVSNVTSKEVGQVTGEHAGKVTGEHVD